MCELLRLQFPRSVVGGSGVDGVRAEPFLPEFGDVFKERSVAFWPFLRLKLTSKHDTILFAELIYKLEVFWREGRHGGFVLALKDGWSRLCLRWHGFRCRRSKVAKVGGLKAFERK